MRTRPAFLLIVVLLFVAPGCSSLFFYPAKQMYENPAAQAYAPQDVFFLSPDGVRLHGWFIPAKGKARGTILFLHGNAQNISTHVNGVLWLVDAGYNLFLFDYRGYGLSQGTPSIPGVHDDAEAALARTFTLPGVDPNRVVVLGQSLGGSVAVSAVALSPDKNRVKALIIDSAFSSWRKIAREKLGDFFLTWPFQYPLSYLFNDDYSPLARIKDIAPVPLLIIQGERDRVVPLHHARDLYAAAGEPKKLWLVPEAGHIQSFYVQRVRRALLHYLARILAGPLGKSGPISP